MKNGDMRCMKYRFSDSDQNRSRGAGGSPAKVFGENTIGHRARMDISSNRFIHNMVTVEQKVEN